MSALFDVVIIGSGPAGVSAAFPLLNSGLKVLMVDGGSNSTNGYPTQDFLTWRHKKEDQFERIVGKDFYALNILKNVTPKMRIPALAYVFEGFNSENKIDSDHFYTIGSLSTGGLSNAWGCGVSQYSDAELGSFPFDTGELDLSYRSIVGRIGISGGGDDDLQDYLGLTNYSQPPIALDILNEHIYSQYKKSTLNKKYSSDFLLGRSRLAVLSQNLNDRLACNLSSNCLWGCSRKSLYSAADELHSLNKYENFTFVPGFIVTSLESLNGAWKVLGTNVLGKKYEFFTGSKILLAAGTIATTRIALTTMNHREKVNILSCPSAAFLICLPKFLGIACQLGLGTAQLSYQVKLKDNISAFGSTFSTTGIPRSEISNKLPFKTPNGLLLLKQLLSSCLIGNLFLPGKFNKTTATLLTNGTLKIDHVNNDIVNSLLYQTKNILNTNFRKLSAFMLPGSFSVGAPGADIHYSGTLPMRKNPILGECYGSGELVTLQGVYAVDASCLPYLSEKPHTLTVMANADRIARKITEGFISKSHLY